MEFMPLVLVVFRVTYRTVEGCTCTSPVGRCVDSLRMRGGRLHRLLRVLRAEAHVDVSGEDVTAAHPVALIERPISAAIDGRLLHSVATLLKFDVISRGNAEIFLGNAAITRREAAISGRLDERSRPVDVISKESHAISARIRATSRAIGVMSIDFVAKSATSSHRPGHRRRDP